MLASPSSWIAPAGKVVEFSAPAFLGSEVVVAGMSSTIQCQKPLPVGASGSYIETTKLWVCWGKPDHDSCGEMSLPPGTPKIHWSVLPRVGLGRIVPEHGFICPITGSDHFDNLSAWLG